MCHIRNALLQIIIVSLFCSVQSAYAINAMTVNIDSMKAEEFSLKNAVLEIYDINQSPAKISLQSATLILPPPFNTFTELDIHCKQFSWHEHYLECSDGQGRFNSKKFKTQFFDFSIQLQDNKTKITIKRLSLAGGMLSVYMQEEADQWQVSIKAKNIDLVKLQAWFSLEGLRVTQGMLDFNMQLKGTQTTIQRFIIRALLTKLSIQDQQGKLASESADLQTEFTLRKNKTGWRWHSNNWLTGDLYVDPVYLQLNKDDEFTVSAQGLWQPGQKKIQVQKFHIEHPHYLDFKGNAELSYQSEFKMETADLTLYVPQLKLATPVYLLPFLESSAFHAIELAGIADVQLKIKQHKLQDASIVVSHLFLAEAENKWAIKQANASINWSKNGGNKQSSYINWQHLNIQAIPFQAGQLDFVSYARQVELLKPANLALLGGLLSIKRFSFSATENSEDANVYFAADIKKLSLQQLTKALDWTPLSGTISGYIPSVRYQDKTLSLDGNIKMQVFDGEVIIKDLASSGLFSDFPQFYTGIEFDRLDLEAVTHTFDIGYIEGRLSGTVQNLYLENWKPVSFYAWVGTPEDDNSRHRISQQAVENIASIGGGGISDVLSRGFLGLFSTFGYRKLGFGCYLYQGVCQLMGVEAVDNGFYLIKGGGLPRVDIIGYNPRLDWNVLLNRLNRIEASDEVIVE